jgi:hypothetical protein
MNGPHAQKVQDSLAPKSQWSVSPWPYRRATRAAARRE